MRDVNDTRYHLLFGADDWQRCTADSALKKWEYDDSHHVVRLQQEIFQFRSTSTSTVYLNLDDRRGAARDSFGHWYWIDTTQTKIMARWAKAKTAETFYPFAEALKQKENSVFQPKPMTALTPSDKLVGLAVTKDGYLVAGLPDRHSLLVIDLYSTDGQPIEVHLPDLAQPYDLSSLADGGLLVLDRVNKQVWILDRYLQPQPAETTDGDPLLFQPKDGDERLSHSGTTIDPLDISSAPDPEGGAPLAIDDPISIESLPDGSFWLLDNPAGESFSRIWHIFPDGKQPTWGVELLTANLVDVGMDNLDLGQIRAHDIAYVPDADNDGNWLNSGVLYLVDTTGDQAFALRYNGTTLRINRDYYPLRGFNGTAIVSVWRDSLVYYHQGDRWQPIKPLPRRRYEEEAVILLPSEIAFDGRDPDCVWHRLCLDACIPPETAVMVEARAANTREDLQWETWEQQPKLYKRPTGSEIPYTNLWDESDRENPDTGTWEFLFQRMRGRYVQIRLTLSGNVRSTPMIRALRAHYPRFSYLAEYLPDMYQQDAISGQFVENFLANPEGIFTLIEGLIAQVQFLMDSRTVPEDATSWLADWLGLVFEPGWTDYQRRLLIAQAPYFFLRRGTLPGMIQAILLAIMPELGPNIFRDDIATYCNSVRVIETFLTRTYSDVAVGDATVVDDGNTDDVSPDLNSSSILSDAAERAHRFIVLLPMTVTEEERRLVEHVIELEKPAHTSYIIKRFWNLFRVNAVRVGYDTILGEGGRFEIFRLNQTALSEGVLSASFPHNLTNRNVLSK